MTSKKIVFSVGKDDLICEICSQSWLQRKPKVLHCDHTFCSSCLDSIRLLFFIKCPICFEATNLKINDIDQLPDHFLAENSTVYEEKLCESHRKPLISPELICITCKKIIKCTLCMDYDHNRDDCRIQSSKTYFNNSKEFRKKFLKQLDEARFIFESNLEKISNDLIKLEKNWYFKLATNFKNIIDAIDNYEKEIVESYKLSLKKTDNPISADDMRKEIEFYKNSMLKLEIKNNFEINLNTQLE